MKTLPADFIVKDELDTRDPAEVYHLWTTADTPQHWRYTSGDTTITYESETYLSASLERSSIQYDENLGTMSVTLSIGLLHDPVLDFIANNPIDSVWVQIFKLFRDQSPYAASSLFVGTIRDVSFKGNEASVNCTGFEFFLNRLVPRFRFSPCCNVFLFEPLCGLDKEDYKTSVLLTNVSSDYLQLTGAAFADKPDGYYAWGFVEIGEDKRMIVKHIGTTVYLRNPIIVSSGVNIDAFAGCNGSVEMCKALFNNKNNFRGFPTIPIANPVRWSGSI